MTRAMRIDGFVRPFPEKAARDLISETGAAVSTSNFMLAVQIANVVQDDLRVQVSLHTDGLPFTIGMPVCSISNLPV